MGRKPCTTVGTALITPALHVCNEEYWIYYVLRGLFEVFGKVVLFDTGSTDRTVEIAQYAADKYHGEIDWVREDLRGDPHAIGQCPTRLRERVTSPWMFLVDGDEIWEESQLIALVRAVEALDSSQIQVGLVGGRNVCYREGRLMMRDKFSADRVFNPEVRWDVRSDYPFQSHGLEQRIAAGKGVYLNNDEIYYWHVRHLQRSSRDHEAYFRVEKLGYFPYSGEYFELPEGWLEPIDPDLPNPYLGRNPCGES